MSQNLAPSAAASTLDRDDVLSEVYRRLGAVHAMLAEAHRVDEDLHHRTLDHLMDILETIEGARARQSRPATSEQARP